MPNQRQQTAESKPKGKKAAEATKAGVRATKIPKSTRSGTASGEKSVLTPKAPRRRVAKRDEVPAKSVISSEEAQLLSEVTFEMIAVRAYFLAEDRHARGVHGDSSGDWHEAERQLRAEAAAIAASLRHDS